MDERTALELVLGAARMYAQELADKADKSEDDARYEAEIWEAIETLGV